MTLTVKKLVIVKLTIKKLVYIFYTFYNIFLSFSLASIIHIMDPNSDFDRLWKQIIDETLEDNIEEIMRYFMRGATTSKK